MMEVDTLKHATLATVSRCGMIWFAENTVTIDMSLRQLINALRKEEVQLLEAVSFGGVGGSQLQIETQQRFVDALV